MRSWVKWAGVAAFALSAGTSIAADHADGNTSGADPTGDINDLYAWIKDDGNLALIMTIGGLTAPKEAAKDRVYVFHVNHHKSVLDKPEDGTNTNVMCTFKSAKDAACWVGKKNYVTGDPSAKAGIQSEDKKMKFHAGPHKDPFFIDLAGLNATIDAVVKAAPNLKFNAAGCPAVDMATSKTLVGLLGGGKDAIAKLNSYAIVLDVNKDQFAGDGDYLSVWASTHEAK